MKEGEVADSFGVADDCSVRSSSLTLSGTCSTVLTFSSWWFGG